MELKGVHSPSSNHALVYTVAEDLRRISRALTTMADEKQEAMQVKSTRTS